MPQELKALSLETIHLVDNKVAALYRNLIAALCVDVGERPGDKTARKVILETIITPAIDPTTGELMRATVEFKLAAKTPISQSAAFPMMHTKAGLKFNAETPGELNGQRLPFESEPQRDRERDDEE